MFRRGIGRARRPARNDVICVTLQRGALETELCARPFTHESPDVEIAGADFGRTLPNEHHVTRGGDPSHHLAATACRGVGEPRSPCGTPTGQELIPNRPNANGPPACVLSDSSAWYGSGPAGDTRAFAVGARTDGADWRLYPDADGGNVRPVRNDAHMTPTTVGAVLVFTSGARAFSNAAITSHDPRTAITAVLELRPDANQVLEARAGDRVSRVGRRRMSHLPSSRPPWR
jgi:hypothetical protein